MQPNLCRTLKVKEDMSQGGSRQPQRPSQLPPEVMQILLPSLKVGGFSGVSGLLFGSFAGIASSKHPVLFAIASSLQWFTLGTTFWATRATVLHTWGEEQAVKPRDRIYASAMAGCVSGGFGGLLRGKGNIIPGAIMFTIFGAGGQTIFNAFESRHSRENTETQERKSSWRDSKWNPIKVLTDDEYERMLREKLFRVNVDIALLDDNIEDLRKQEAEKKAREEEQKGNEPDP